MSTNTRSLTSGKSATLSGRNQGVAPPTGGEPLPAYKTKVTKGNRHEAMGGSANLQPGARHLMIDPHPMHFGTAITGYVQGPRDDYFQKYSADNEDANGLLPHQYGDLTVVPNMVDIVLPPAGERAA